jgi:hypothetical protein
LKDLFCIQFGNGYISFMLQNRTYSILILPIILLLASVFPLSAMSCSTYKAEQAEPMHNMACCNKVSTSQATLPCPIPGFMTSGTVCSCQMTPASEISRKAVLSAPVSVLKIAVREVLFQQNPEPPTPIYATGDPPDLHSTIPVFLRLCTLLN